MNILSGQKYTSERMSEWVDGWMDGLGVCVCGDEVSLGQLLATTTTKIVIKSTTTNNSWISISSSYDDIQNKERMKEWRRKKRWIKYKTLFYKVK